MKHILSFILFAGLLTVSAGAQTGKSPEPDSTRLKPLLRMPSPEFDRMRPYSDDSRVYRKVPRLRIPAPQDSARTRILAERRSPHDNMPIIRLYRPYPGDRMPVYRPDSTIDFKLKIKKLEKFNLPYPPRR
jgi:hypothetical protein